MAKPEKIRSSVTVKLMVVSAVFLIVPALLYGRFEQADAERKQLMVTNLQIQGRLAAQALQEKLIAAGPRAPVEAQDLLDSVSRGELWLKLLLRPADDASSYFYIASAPHVTAEQLSAEREALIASGQLLKATESCAGNRPLAAQFENPTGVTELLTSLTPFHTEQGCWLVVTSYPEDPVIASLTKPFSSAPELRWAALFYVIMAVLSVWAGLSIWQSLRRFGSLARRLSESNIEPSARFVEGYLRVELRGIGGAAYAERLDRASAAGRQRDGLGNATHRLEVVLKRNDLGAERGEDGIRAWAADRPNTCPCSQAPSAALRAPADRGPDRPSNRAPARAAQRRRAPAARAPGRR